MSIENVSSSDWFLEPSMWSMTAYKDTLPGFAQTTHKHGREKKTVKENK